MKDVSETRSARYICRLMLWLIDMRSVEVCREEKVFEGEKEGVYIPFTRTIVSKAVNVKLCDISVKYLNTSLIV